MSTLRPAFPTQSFIALASGRPTQHAPNVPRSSPAASAWMLDAMGDHALLLVLAYLIREFSMSTRTAGLLNSPHAGCFRNRRADFRRHRRPHRPHAFADGLHPRLFSFECSLRPGAFNSATRDFSISSRSRYGRRMECHLPALIAETWRPEHRGKALGLMQSSYAIGEAIAAGVVFVRPSPFRLARGLLRGRSTCVDGGLDSPRRPRTRKLEAPRRIGRRCPAKINLPRLVRQRRCGSARSPPQ